MTSHNDPPPGRRHRTSNICPDTLFTTSKRRGDGVSSREDARPGHVASAPHAKHSATTSYLLSNLHCPSCVSSIKAVIQETCGDDAIWVSPNVVTSVVTVEHKDTPRSSVSAMAKALADAGFDIDGITSTIPEDQREISTANDAAEASAAAAATVSSISAAQPPVSGSGPASVPASAPGSPPTTTPANADASSSNPRPFGVDIPRGDEAAASGSMLQRRDRTRTQGSLLQRLKKSPTARQRAHLEVCEKCQRPGEIQGATSVSRQSATRVPVGSVAAHADASRGDSKTATATCGLDGSDEASQQGRQHIPGFPVGSIAKSDTAPRATELRTVATGAHNSPKEDKAPLWRATIAIGGMTCAVCVNTITQELNKRPWVDKAVVNLISNSATIDFYHQSQVPNIVDAIEDLGYEANIDQVTDLANGPHEAAAEREVDVRIGGMFCANCPERVVGTMGWFQERGLEVLSNPTVDRPILRIRYVPDAPFFTIRNVIEAIQATDSRLTATVYHAPTLEERSQMMARRHYFQLLWRMALAAVMAVPSLVIGIVYMSLVSDSNRGKMMLMKPAVSGISRAQIILFALATPVYFLSASIFHMRALKELYTMWRPGSRTPVGQRFYKFGSMNMLMSLGTTIAYFSSVGQMIAAGVNKPDHTPDSEFYFDSVVFLTLFLLIGRLVEQYTKARTGDAVEALIKLRPSSASLVEADKDGQTVTTTTKTVQVDMLELGDVVRVTHGASPPFDGIIVQGDSSFDESSLTGESRPIKKATGDDVFAGTINKQSPVLVQITGTGGSSMLDQIVAVVREGQTRRAPLEAIADVMTAYFVPAITLIAIATWVIWMALGLSHVLPQDWLSRNGDAEGPVQFSLQFAIAVFVVACPCGLALAAPTAIFVGGGIAAKHGILAKGGGEAFEKASRIDVVVFDKTGTLTVGGEPKVTDSSILPDKGEVSRDGDSHEAILLAALCAVEDNSSHPIARAIVAFCSSRLHDSKTSHGVDLDDMHEIPGKGMRATFRYRSGEAITTTELLAGNEALMSDYGVALSPRVASQLQKWKDEAKSVALVATRLAYLSENSDQDEGGNNSSNSNSSDAATAADWAISATLAISDQIRNETVPVIRALKSSGVQVWMLSGDNASTAQAVAGRIGINPKNVLAGVLPSGKADKIKYLQSTQSPRGNGKSGRATVAMVGDGINDSPALTAADVGIAIGSGSDVAISSAGFVLIKSDLRAVVTLLGLSRCVFKRIKTNFGWAVIYNLVAVPVAAGVFFPIKDGSGNHVRLDPVWASLAMALSSISVVVSSLLLRTKIPVLGYRASEVKMVEQTRPGGG